MSRRGETGKPATNRGRGAALLLLAVVMLSGCEPSGRSLPQVVVHKHAGCKCCRLWAQQLRKEGLVVRADNIADLAPVRRRLGVPPHRESCHTAEAGGYFIEGHVPVAEVKRLLVERPSGRGLVVPGMPTGSPGMEMPSGRVVPYDVLFMKEDGSLHVAAQYGRDFGVRPVTSNN